MRTKKRNFLINLNSLLTSKWHYLQEGRVVWAVIQRGVWVWILTTTPCRKLSSWHGDSIVSTGSVYAWQSFNQVNIVWFIYLTRWQFLWRMPNLPDHIAHMASIASPDTVPCIAVALTRGCWWFFFLVFLVFLPPGVLIVELLFL